MCSRKTKKKKKECSVEAVRNSSYFDFETALENEKKDLLNYQTSHFPYEKLNAKLKKLLR